MLVFYIVKMLCLSGVDPSVSLGTQPRSQGLRNERLDQFRLKFMQNSYLFWRLSVQNIHFSLRHPQ